MIHGGAVLMPFVDGPRDLHALRLGIRRGLQGGVQRQAAPIVGRSQQRGFVLAERGARRSVHGNTSSQCQLHLLDGASIGLLVVCWDCLRQSKNLTHSHDFWPFTTSSGPYRLIQ